MWCVFEFTTEWLLTPIGQLRTDLMYTAIAVSAKNKDIGNCRLGNDVINLFGFDYRVAARRECGMSKQQAAYKECPENLSRATPVSPP